MSNLFSLVTLAEYLGLSPKAAMGLPVTIEKCAESVGWHVNMIVSEIYRNKELGEYVVELCETITADEVFPPAEAA